MHWRRETGKLPLILRPPPGMDDLEIEMLEVIAQTDESYHLNDPVNVPTLKDFMGTDKAGPMSCGQSENQCAGQHSVY